MHSYVYLIFFFRLEKPVLILVLMEDALVRTGEFKNLVSKELVLILVLMEDALVLIHLSG